MAAPAADRARRRAHAEGAREGRPVPPGRGRGRAEDWASPERRWGRSHQQVSAGDGKVEEAARVLEPSSLREQAASPRGEFEAPRAGGGKGFGPGRRLKGEERPAESGGHKERGRGLPGALQRTRLPLALAFVPGRGCLLHASSPSERRRPDGPASADLSRPSGERRGWHGPPLLGAGPQGRTPQPPFPVSSLLLFQEAFLGSRGWARVAPGTHPCAAPPPPLPAPRTRSSRDPPGEGTRGSAETSLFLESRPASSPSRCSLPCPLPPLPSGPRGVSLDPRPPNLMEFRMGGSKPRRSPELLLWVRRPLGTQEEMET